MFLLAFAVTACSTLHRQQVVPLEEIKLPPRFAISVYARDVPRARTMTFGTGGTLFVGTYAEGKVYAILPPEGRAKPVVLTIAENLQDPGGVAFRAGSLYVAEHTRILRFDDIEQNLNNPPKPVVVYAGLPKQRIHNLHTIHFGPDGLLYVSVGSPCNICNPDPSRYAILARLDVTAKNPVLEVVARGVRDAQGYDWHPVNQELWFVDNGRDGLGNNAPPDELNHARRSKLHFGYPYCHGGDVRDPKFGAGQSCSEFTPPALKLPAHVAPLGMRFYTGKQFPADYRNRIFIAEHGSSDRNPRIGARISMVTVRNNKVEKYETFAEGWLKGNALLGRPVDIIVAPDGALLVSDDQAGVIYRITCEV